MRDDDYNRLMGSQANSKHFAIVFLITILMCLLLVWSVASAEEHLPYVDEQCAFSFACQDEKTWELVYQGEVISEPNEDLTEEECKALLEELEPQTKPFEIIECRPRLVERQKI